MEYSDKIKFENLCRIAEEMANKLQALADEANDNGRHEVKDELDLIADKYWFFKLKVLGKLRNEP